MFRKYGDRWLNLTQICYTEEGGSTTEGSITIHFNNGRRLILNLSEQEREDLGATLASYGNEAWCKLSFLPDCRRYRG
jgi:hypothetical protein